MRYQTAKPTLKARSALSHVGVKKTGKFKRIGWWSSVSEINKEQFYIKTNSVYQ